MHKPARAFLPALLLALLVAAPASAQPPVFDQPYQARLALGDIPTTTTAEGPGWNLEQRVRVDHVAGNDTTVTLRVPADMQAGTPTCTCSALGSERSGADTLLHIRGNEPTGTYEVRLPSSQGASGHLNLTLEAPGYATNGVLVVYVPGGHTLQAPIAPDDQLACTAQAGDCTIHSFRGTEARPLPMPFLVTVAPQAATPPPQDAPATVDLTPWLYAAVAFALGCLFWALLVSRGTVQKRSRKQAVTTAAHTQVASEPVAVLEGKKRALLAALKEVEVAKMNAEMDTATYDAVKADFKRQAVTVMRALESGEARKE